MASAITSAQDLPRPAVPLEPIGAILDAFRTHRVVVLGENHWGQWDLEFRLALIRDPRLPAIVNDIVVESGTADLQNEMDEYMSGSAVPGDFLERVLIRAMGTFRNHIYEEFFRAVRSVNDGLPAERRLRVVLGDAPDYQSRDQHVANVIRREVLDRNRRALVVYGDEHTTRRHPIYRDDVEEEKTFVTRLESSGETVFAIWVQSTTAITSGCEQLQLLQPSISSWPRPSLALVPGTVLGSPEYYFYSPILDWRLAKRQRRMNEMVDAVLCLRH